MNLNYREDGERIVIPRDKALEEFKEYLAKHNPDLNISKILSRPILKREPITAYGVIEFFIDKDKIWYHVFKRRHTAEYSTLIRGYAQKSEIFKFASLLSKDERSRIINMDWDDLWDDYWSDHSDGAYTRLRSQAMRRFPEIKRAVEILEKHTICQVPNRPFIFPKGKANKDENPINAAFRECKEETRRDIYNSDMGELYFNSPIIQSYLGSNDRKYIEHYYVWRSYSLNKSPISEVKSKLRPTTISHEMEEDKWIFIPIFDSKKNQWEWEKSINPYSTFQIYHRHFKAIMDIHNHVT